MTKIVLHIKRGTKGKEFLGALRESEFQKEVPNLEINEEGIQREVVLSRTPLGGQEVSVSDQLLYLFDAASMVKLVFEGIISNTAYALIVRTLQAGKKFFSANNKQKGNAWGAKIEITKKMSNDRVQTIHFFLDNIPEAKLFEATSKIEERMNQLSGILGEEYMGQLKNIGFSFDDSDSWKMVGVEKFDGTTELPVSS